MSARKSLSSIAKLRKSVMNGLVRPNDLRPPSMPNAKCMPVAVRHCDDDDEYAHKSGRVDSR